MSILQTYSTPRLLQADNTKLQLCYLMQLFLVIVLFAVYSMVYHKAHQLHCNVQGVTTFQSFGGFYMPEETWDLTEKYPSIFQKFWSASEIIQLNSDGFTVMSNVVVTPNQTQTTCPESPNVPNSICRNVDNIDNTNSSAITNDNVGVPFTNCKKGAQSVSGLQTGRCVENTDDTLKFYGIQQGEPGTMTCEIEGWCPLLPLSGKPYGLGNAYTGAMLEYSKNLIVLLKTTADFPECGQKYYGMQELREGKAQCSYHPINDPTCPWFTIHDLVLYAGFISYANVASTGQIFRITVKWDCNFDWKSTCVPRYTISPVFGRYQQWEQQSYYWEEPIYYGQGTRTLVRKFGLKFIIEHQGEGRKTTIWLLMKTFSLGFPYLFIPGFVVTFLYNKFFKNASMFRRKKYYQFDDNAIQDDDNMRTKLV